MPQDRSRLPIQVAGSTANFLAVQDDPAAPAAELGEPLRVQRHTITGTHDVRLLLDDVEQAFPGEIGCDAFGFVENDPQFVQRLDDLDAITVDVLVEPVLVDGVGQVYRGLGVAAPDEQECVLHPEAGVVADAADHEDVPGAVVGVEVGAIVEVAVRGARPRDRLGDLMYRELVERSEHY